MPRQSKSDRPAKVHPGDETEGLTFCFVQPDAGATNAGLVAGYEVAVTCIAESGDAFALVEQRLSLGEDYAHRDERVIVPLEVPAGAASLEIAISAIGEDSSDGSFETASAPSIWRLERGTIVDRPMHARERPLKVLPAPSAIPGVRWSAWPETTTHETEHPAPDETTIGVGDRVVAAIDGVEADGVLEEVIDHPGGPRAKVSLSSTAEIVEVDTADVARAPAEASR